MSAILFPQFRFTSIHARRLRSAGTAKRARGGVTRRASSAPRLPKSSYTRGWGGAKTRVRKRRETFNWVFLSSIISARGLKLPGRESSPFSSDGDVDARARVNIEHRQRLFQFFRYFSPLKILLYSAANERSKHSIELNFKH